MKDHGAEENTEMNARAVAFISISLAWTEMIRILENGRNNYRLYQVMTPIAATTSSTSFSEQINMALGVWYEANILAFSP